MPSQTFFHLSQEKQTTILEAAQKEFGRVLYAEASLNRIIREANIARGTFYLYFKDKEDLYFYLLDHYRELHLKTILEEIQNNSGDFIRGVISLYDRVISYCETKNDHFFQNVFLNMRYSMEKKYATKEPPILEEGFRLRFFEVVDDNLYRLHQDDLFEAFELAMMITMSALTYRFMHDTDPSEERSHYLKRLSILQYGIYQKKECEL